MVCAVVVGISGDDERGHTGIRQVFVRAVVRDVIGEKERAHTVVEEVIVIYLINVGIITLGVTRNHSAAYVEGRCACGLIGKGEIPYAGVDRRGLYDVSGAVLEIYGRLVKSRGGLGDGLYADNESFGLICRELKRLLELRESLTVIVAVRVDVAFVDIVEHVHVVVVLIAKLGLERVAGGIGKGRDLEHHILFVRNGGYVYLHRLALVLRHFYGVGVISG